MAEEGFSGFTDSEIHEQRVITYTKVIQNTENDIEVLESASSKFLFFYSLNLQYNCEFCKCMLKCSLLRLTA